MEKKFYAELEIMLFDNDVITSSSCECEDCDEEHTCGEDGEECEFTECEPNWLE